MTRHATRLAALSLAALVALPATAQDAPTADTVVATVNGQDITLGHVLAVRRTLPAEYQQLQPQVLWDGIVDQLIRQEVLAQDESARETPLVRRTVENERRALLASTVMADIVEDAVTEDALRAAYETQFSADETALEYNASHILVDSLDRAAALAEEAAAGADFAALARENSTGPSGPNGGSLGWFGEGMMVEPFQTAVADMEPGDISAPVETQFGWHVIRLNDTRVPEAPAFEEVRPQIAERLQAEAVNAYLDAQMAGAEVTRAPDVGAALLGRQDLLEN